MRIAHALAAMLCATAVIVTLTPATSPAQEAECAVGNLNPPSPLYQYEVFMGNEAYAYRVDPPEQCGCNDGYFALLNVTQLLHFEVQQVPAVLNVQVSLREAVQDPGTGCLIPGAPLAESVHMQVPVDEPGVQAITVPIDPMIVPFDETYFLVLAYEGGSPAQLVEDDMPAPCVAFIDRGFGWEDLDGPDKSGDGKAIVFGDVVCATATVDGESETWGAIKSLYR